MHRNRPLTAVATLLLGIALAACSQAGPIVTLDVPPLAVAGSARGFEFVSFQFDLYLVPIGDPETDYAANVLANDHENYTYEHPGGGGSGRGGGYRPPHYVRGPGATYSDTYQNVTQPPRELDAFFHFNGRDVAGAALAVTVLDSGRHSIVLTADADPTRTPLALGAPLADGGYTLEFRTDSLQGSRITLVPATSLVGDFNGDGRVDLGDFGTLKAHFGGPGTSGEGDANGDGQVDLTDFGLLEQSFGKGGAAAVPEPETATLTAIGLTLFAGFRRRRIRRLAP